MKLVQNRDTVFKNVFRPHETIKRVFSNFSSLKSVFEKLHFRDGSVWTVGLTVEIKLRVFFAVVRNLLKLFFY